MAKEKNRSFITELPLQVNDQQARTLLVRMDAARQVYNACLGESLKRLRLMRESKQVQAARKMQRGKRRTTAFADGRTRFKFREYDLHSYAKQFSHSWLGDHLDSNTVQKIATRAFNATLQYAVGQCGKPRFKGKHQLISVEGKSNKSGIRWRGDRVVWTGLKLQAVLPKDDEDGNLKDKVIQHGLESPVKYVRLVSRRVHGKLRFYAQLNGEGLPYQKEKNRMGDGYVGLDIGPSTVAVVGKEKARLGLFCYPLEVPQQKIRRLQRKLDRQRRTNNPRNYNADGTTKSGASKWVKSAGYRRTQSQITELHRHLAVYRKSLHAQLVNDILRMGKFIHLEKLSYRAFQRQYGKSVGMRAPGLFVVMLRRKAESAGGVVYEYSTRHTRHFQLCHGCGTLGMKSLSQRWHICGCGIVAQRDLYSAFLAFCMDGETFNADYAREAWTSADTRLRAALKDAELTNGRHVPASFGLKRSQSQLPAILDEEVCDAQVVVPNQIIGWREPVRASSTPRTPRL